MKKESGLRAKTVALPISLILILNAVRASHDHKQCALVTCRLSCRKWVSSPTDTPSCRSIESFFKPSLPFTESWSC